MKKPNILGSGVVVLAAIAVHAANAQKSGKIEFDAYVTWRLIDTIDSSGGRGMIGEGTGYDRLVNGNAPFDLLTFRCVGYHQKIGEKATQAGGCVKTDKDGDHIFYTYTQDDWTFTGGTGKFKGITGTGGFNPLYYHDSGDWGWEVVAHHTGDWEIK